MNLYYSKNSLNKKKGDRSDPRVHIAASMIIVVAFLIITKLFILMVWQGQFYKAMAAGSHEVFAQLFPKRGIVFIQDTRTSEKYPLALNRDFFLLFADTRLIENQDDIENIIEKLSDIFEYEDEKKDEIRLQLSKKDDPYEPIEKKVDEKTKEIIDALELPGIAFIRSSHRFYPEENLGAHIIGFLGKDSGGNSVGRYGVEGYWDKELSGSGGFYEGLKSAVGNRIAFGDVKFEPARDGANITLTIDRTIQFQTCKILQEAMEEYEAQSATAIVMDPNTGAIRAMCSLPDFNPNNYGSVKSVSVFNNSAIFTPYEPGSIFKPIVMAAAINESVLTPQTYFYDTGVKEGVCDTPIKNAEGRIYEDQNMIGVLENSINTGMVFVVERLGKENLRTYIENFGFGAKNGLKLDTEVGGTLESLSRNKSNKVGCYTATASFGQGITATPLQMTSAFGSLANGGLFLRPYVVEEIDYSNGKIEKTKTKEIRRVISGSSSSLISGMLVNVVDNGQAGGAKVSGFYVAGKTGTAQISGIGGYTDETNHSFVGYAPIDDPQFVLFIKFEKPQRSYSSMTAAPTFGKIAKFILEYYGVPPSR
ncbi:MAG: penicillin-binding protein 2 [Candidatus Magasanikbacteria bacterium]|nr:penicillin-binding protein 2 [Candidatus Magasanikbacteria bacterium]